jgi:dTDP-4-amino-4,6-dideoxygalactose transaminase
MLKEIFRNRATSIINDFINSNKIEKSFILPANICPVVPLVFYKNKIKTKFIDIDNKTLNICKDEVFSEIENSSGILWNHTFGKETDQKKFFLDLKKKKENFLIIDDKCLCIPTTKLTKKIYSDLEIYSTGYAKYCDLGYGGYGISNEKIKFFKTNYSKQTSHNLKQKIEKSIFKKKILRNTETNWLKNKKIYKTDFYLAKIESLLNRINIHKKKINNIYKTNLPNEIILDQNTNVWRFNILIKKKEILLKEIFNNNLFASTHFYSSSKLFKNERKKNTDILYKNVINLFNDLRFNESKALKISEIINTHYKMYGPGEKP